MSTYTTTSGPSTPLAHLRALWLRRQRPTATQQPRLSPRVGEAGLELLATDHGYTTLTTAASGTITLLWKATSAAVRGVGRALASGARAVAVAVGRVSTGLSQRLTHRIDTTTSAVAEAWQRTDTAVRQVGAACREALQEPTVRRTTTAAAQAATLWLLLAVLTDGALPTQVVMAAPWSMGVVAASLNPTAALGAVTAVGGLALLVALARFAARPSTDGSPTPTGPASPGEQADPMPAAWGWATRGNGQQGHVDQLQAAAAQVLPNLDDVARQVHIEIQPDGSVAVQGIPETVPPDIGQALAEAAQREAERHLRRILRIRRAPTRNDRRVVTKAAREAVVAEARQCSNGIASAA